MYMSILGGSVDFFLPTPIPTSCTSQFLTPPPPSGYLKVPRPTPLNLTLRPCMERASQKMEANYSTEMSHDPDVFIQLYFGCN
jgi:hypothetical protein